MNKAIALMMLMLAASGRPAWADPITLSLLPASQDVTVGDIVSVDVVIAGLGVGGPPKVGAFDLHTDFDPSILSPSGVLFGPLLGDPSLFEAFTSASLLPVRVEFAEASLLSDLDLNAMQPSSFALATLLFDVVGFGVSPLTFSQIVVDDPFGGKLTVFGDGATVTSVPEPSTWVLVVTALAARRRSFRTKA